MQLPTTSTICKGAAKGSKVTVESASSHAGVWKLPIFPEFFNIVSFLEVSAWAQIQPRGPYRSSEKATLIAVTEQILMIPTSFDISNQVALQPRSSVRIESLAKCYIVVVNAWVERKVQIESWSSACESRLVQLSTSSLPIGRRCNEDTHRKCHWWTECVVDSWEMLSSLLSAQLYHVWQVLAYSYAKEFPIGSR